MEDEAFTERINIDRPRARGTFVSGQTVFSRYTLEAQVGRGGMGVVWRARDVKLDRLVALKFLPPEVAADAEAVRDLKLETRRCLDLTHANIVRVYDFIEDEFGAAIAMEYVEGESLAKLKASAPGGCLAAGDLTPFVAQLCAALRYAHEVAKVVHHDLKPANVLLASGGTLKVTDFGIARSLTETQARLTGRLATSGTLLYMSPQQIAGEKPTTADDIYALGSLLYELLTGKPPFFRGDALSLRQQVMEKTPAPLEAHRKEVGATGPEIPPEWSETILACLAKTPEARPASADDVARRLGVLLDPMPVSATAALFPLTAGRTDKFALEIGAGPRRSLVPWLCGIGTLLLALTASVIYFGIYAPEQARRLAEQERAREAEFAQQAERARQAELALQAERARQAEEKRVAAEQLAVEQRKKDQAVRAQMTRDQQAYSAIMSRIAATVDSSPAKEINDTREAVTAYLRTAPAGYRAAVETAWGQREAAWNAAVAASRPGSLLLETDPPGATVTLYPRNEHKTSPALFESVKPGEVLLRVEKEGYETREVPFVMKPGSTNQIPVVKLTSIYGALDIVSDPSDLLVVVEGNGRRLEGRTPFHPTQLQPATYQVTFQRRVWIQKKTVTVARGKDVTVFGDKGFTLELRSRPPGAQITVEGTVVGTTPLSLSDIPPRDYRVTATLEGYEVLTKIVTVTRPETLTLPLIEKPLPKALRRLTGYRWHYESFATSADLTFTALGKIGGNHHSGLGGPVRDVGVADAFNDSTNTMTVHFTAADNKPFYSGSVQLKLIDDEHLEASWTNNGSAERWVFQREAVKAVKPGEAVKTPKAGKKK